MASWQFCLRLGCSLERGIHSYFLPSQQFAYSMGNPQRLFTFQTNRLFNLCSALYLRTRSLVKSLCRHFMGKPISTFVLFLLSLFCLFCLVSFHFSNLVFFSCEALFDYPSFLFGRVVEILTSDCDTARILGPSSCPQQDACFHQPYYSR